MLRQLRPLSHTAQPHRPAQRRRLGRRHLQSGRQRPRLGHPGPAGRQDRHRREFCDRRRRRNGQHGAQVPRSAQPGRHGRSWLQSRHEHEQRCLRRWPFSPTARSWSAAVSTPDSPAASATTSAGSTPTARSTRASPRASTAPSIRIAIQPDGKILVGGLFTHMGGAVRRHRPQPHRPAQRRRHGRSVVQSGRGPAQSIAIAVQPDGKILVGGNFTGLGGGTGTTPRVRHRPPQRRRHRGHDLQSRRQQLRLHVRRADRRPDPGRRQLHHARRRRLGHNHAQPHRPAQRRRLAGSHLQSGRERRSSRAWRIQPDGNVLVGGTFTGPGRRHRHDGPALHRAHC